MNRDFIDKKGYFAILSKKETEKHYKVYFFKSGKELEFEDEKAAIAALHAAGYELKVSRGSVSRK